jgi:hypothetical protein
MPAYFFLKEDTTSMAMIVNNWVDWFSYIWEGVLRTAMEGFCLKKKIKIWTYQQTKNVELMDPLLVKTELVGMFAFPSLFFHFIFARHNLYFIRH